MAPSTQIPTDTWVAASWDEYTRMLDAPSYEAAKLYYFDDKLRVEMSAVGPDHSRDNATVILAISLFGLVNGIPLNALINCSYQKVGLQGCQPDMSYYIGDNVVNTPQGASVVNLNNLSPPSLAIEIAKTSLLDDLGAKRLLYEALNIAEYWIVDVDAARVMAFAIANQGSQQIRQSTVLPGLRMAILEAAIQCSREVDQTAVGQWLMAQFSAPALET